MKCIKVVCSMDLGCSFSQVRLFLGQNKEITLSIRKLLFFKKITG